MRQMGSEETALKKGEEICGGFQNAALTDQLPISCTCGAVIWNNDVPLDNIISQADKALYQAKLNGKGGCCVRHQSGLPDSSNDRQNGSRD
jgi:PleD family two-component response regulator